MKKYLFLLLLPLITVVLNSCDDDDDKGLNPDLIKGRWEISAPDQSENTLMYIFETVKGFNNYGTVEVKSINEDGTIEEIPVRKYDWHAAGPQNNNGVLDITLTPAGVDGSDPDFYYETYIITRLTSAKMIWQGVYPASIKDQSVEFIRRLPD